MFSAFQPSGPTYSYFGEVWWDFIGINFYRGTNWSDKAYGFSGNDVLRMGGGSDTAYGGAGQDDISGEAGHDFLFGGDGRDGIYGGDGDDSLFGGEGDDFLGGGDGADFINGGAGIDTVNYNGGFYSPYGLIGVTVNLQTGTGSGADAEGDTIVNVENVNGSYYADTITGNDQDNTLDGGAGDDVLFGGAGNDVLIGGWNWTENPTYGDIMTGGTGSDRFVFETDVGGPNNDNHSPAHDRDYITDFTQGEDKIDLTSMNFDVVPFSGVQNDYTTVDSAEVWLNWSNIEGFGASTLVVARNDNLEEIQFFVQGFQALTVDDFIL